MAKEKKEAEAAEPVAEVEAEVVTEPIAEPVAAPSPPGAYKTDKTYPAAVWEPRERTVPTHSYLVEFFGGQANYPTDTIVANDPSEAISFFIMKHGIRNGSKYGRHVTLLEPTV